MDRFATAVLIAAGVVASMAASFSPFLVGALVEGIGLSIRQAGIVASAEMLGAVAGALYTARSIGHRDRKTLIVGGLALFAFGNGIAAFVTSFAVMAVVRIGCGVCSAAAVAAACSGIACRPSAERNFGSYYFAMIASSALGAAVIPLLVAAAGIRGLLLAFACMALLTAAAAGRMLPRMPAEPLASGKFAVTPHGAAALGGMLLWFVSFGAIWTFVERLGATIPLSAASIGLALALSQGGGAGGALIASIVGARLGGRVPLFAASLVFVAAAVGLLSARSLSGFAACVLCINFGFSLGLPYLSALIARIDPTGRLVALGTVMQAAGLAVGPGAGALVIGDGTVANSIILGICAGVLSGALVTFVTRSAGAERPSHKEIKTA